MKTISFETMADNTPVVRLELTQAQCNVIHSALLEFDKYFTGSWKEPRNERIRQFLTDEFFKLDDDFRDIEREIRENER